MAVRTLKRIGRPIGENLHDRMEAMPLHHVTWPGSMERIEREHPSLIVERNGNLLSVDPGRSNSLVYGFRRDAEFIEHFEGMFDELLPRLRKELGDGSVRFRLSHAPSRPVVEPVLKRLWFTPRRDWLGFTLERGTKLPSATVRGVKFRPGGVSDVPDIVRIDEEAFSRTPIGMDAMHALVASGSHSLLIAETARAGTVGFATYERPEPADGYIGTIAVSQSHRGLGIGRALTVRAAKDLFASGAQRVGLTTDESNGTAIRLYVGLGFKQTRGGRDYIRPTNAKAVEQLKLKGQGKFIKFGGWR